MKSLVKGHSSLGHLGKGLRLLLPELEPEKHT